MTSLTISVDPQPYGSAYQIAIKDTVTEAEDSGVGPTEYLVFTDVFLKAAANHGLHPITRFNSTLDEFFEKADIHSPFKHFYPNFPTKNHDPSLELASSINIAFAFHKRSSKA